MMSSSECEKNHQIKEDCYMKKTSLVIMAAGIGSRFGGGIKQLAPVDLTAVVFGGLLHGDSGFYSFK